MKKLTINAKRKPPAFALALFLAIGFVFPLSANSQTTMEWMVLSIMRSQAQISNPEQSVIFVFEPPHERNTTIFRTDDENLIVK